VLGAHAEAFGDSRIQTYLDTWLVAMISISISLAEATELHEIF